MFSMTGFGKGEYKADGIEISVEVKTVNNRYLDVAIKSPKIFNAYEEIIRSAVRERITRGHLDVFVNYIDKRERPKSLYVDAGAASGYYAAAKNSKICFPALRTTSRSRRSCARPTSSGRKRRRARTRRF